MIKIIEKTGRLYSTIIITFIAVLFTQIITSLTYYFSHNEISITGRISSIACPLIIAPLLSWWFFDLLLKINKLEKEMREIATFDALTKVYNRNSFFSHANSLFALMKQRKTAHFNYLY